MKFIVITLCLAYPVFASLKEDRQQWINFKSKHEKLYQNQQEEKSRFSIFQQNLREIEEHNKDYDVGKTTYTKGVNQFADFTKEEINSMLNYQSTRPSYLTKSIYEKPIGADVPKSIDWREKGAVTNVKDQKTCSSCWAFSTIGSVEGFHFLKSGQLVSLSPQQLVDCSKKINMGCQGGLEAPAFEYIKDNGIQSDDSYPYVNRGQACNFNSSSVVLKIKDFVQIESGNEDALLSAVGLLGPISVAVDARSLILYKGGVLTDPLCSKKYADHAVLAVGYGNDNTTGLDYWLVKNTWNTGWGENGYFRLKRGSNECAIALDGIYPVL